MKGKVLAMLLVGFGIVVAEIINAFVLAFCFHLFYDHYFSYAFNLPPLGLPCLFWGFAFLCCFVKMCRGTKSNDK